jgi:cytochrome c oxidase subunit 4
VAALAIAFAKAALIVLVFMHVQYSSRLTKLFAAAGFFWLIILFLFTFSDYLTRAWL